jgi:hypothetical protein
VIQVKIFELDKHRNETTFRPYLAARHVLEDIGIQFTEGDSYDFAWIGQASIADKKLPLEQSVEMGIRFCEGLGDFMIFDGQDSHSLIGTVDVLRETDCLLLLKNTLLREWDMYNVPTPNGRWYWRGLGEGNYSVPDIHELKDRITLSGTNWMSTTNVKFFGTEYFDKVHDVCGLFGYPASPNSEHGLEHYKLYNAHRKPCVDILKKLPRTNTLQDGVKIPIQRYYKIMSESKIVVSPTGYGEMTPRDIEAIGMGCIVIKPTVDHLVSEPWIFDEGRVYIGCRHDYADLEEKIDFVLSDFKNLQAEMYEYSFKKYMYMYGDPTRLAIHLHNIFGEKLNGVITHEN